MTSQLGAGKEEDEPMGRRGRRRGGRFHFPGSGEEQVAMVPQSNNAMLKPNDEILSSKKLISSRSVQRMALIISPYGNNKQRLTPETSPIFWAKKKGRRVTSFLRCGGVAWE